MRCVVLFHLGHMTSSGTSTRVDDAHQTGNSCRWNSAEHKYSISLGPHTRTLAHAMTTNHVRRDREEMPVKARVVFRARWPTSRTCRHKASTIEPSRRQPSDGAITGVISDGHLAVGVIDVVVGR